MMRPDHRAVDHVRARIVLDRFGERLQHGVEHAGLDSPAIPSEYAVPLAMLIRQLPPLRPRPRRPYHTFKIGPVVTRRPATTTSLRRQQRPDQPPLLVRHTDPIAQYRLKKAALNQPLSLSSNLVQYA